MLDNNLGSLVETLRIKASKAIEEMNSDEKLKALGMVRVSITETRRELAVQMAYYSRGRMKSPDVKAMYSAAGLYSIRDSEANTPITWTLQSKHLEGKAIDLCPVAKNNVQWWTAPKEVWERMGEIGEKHGLTWGGRWKNTDCPHFEV